MSSLLALPSDPVIRKPLSEPPAAPLAGQLGGVCTALDAQQAVDLPQVTIADPVVREDDAGLPSRIGPDSEPNVARQTAITASGVQRDEADDFDEFEDDDFDDEFDDDFEEEFEDEYEAEDDGFGEFGSDFDGDSGSDDDDDAFEDGD